jgi:hypothetical protein
MLTYTGKWEARDQWCYFEEIKEEHIVGEERENICPIRFS